MGLVMRESAVTVFAQSVDIFVLICFWFHGCFFVILILMYAFIVLALFYCQADFDVDNVQHCKLVNC